MRASVAFLVVIASSLALPAATPPDRINYQGVLRDAAGAPRNGPFDMILRLYDQPFGGVEILADWHVGGLATPVMVTNGLFNVEIGTGDMIDGWGPGFYQALGPAFKDYGELWLDLQIGGEFLTPRLRLASAGYALNAASLAGRTADEFLDTGPSPQTKSGPLTLSGASGSGEPSLTSIGIVGARVESTSGSLAELARYGDGLWATSGPGPGSGGVFYAYGGSAVQALGAYTGGYFQDLDNSSWAYVANGAYGARIQGETTGAYIQTPGAATSVWLADQGYGIRATGLASNVLNATTAGGYFELRDPSGAGMLATAHLAHAWKNFAGGPLFSTAAVFQNVASGAHVSIAEGGGVSADGVWAESGLPSSWGGVFISGTWSGICCGGGIAGLGQERGAYFEDTDSAGWANVGYQSYKILGSGSVAFAQNHPTEKDRVIVYNSPEGDEVGTYTRGSARLAGGQARVALGETFAWVTNPDLGLTAHLTPRGAPVPLSVESLTTKELVVRAPADAPADLEFDYLVYGLRIGFEETSIVQEKKREAFIPSMEDHRKLHAEHPELKRFTALERVKAMRAGSGREEAPDLSASTALREAIHEFDPMVDAPRVDSAAPGRPDDRHASRLGVAPRSQSPTANGAATAAARSAVAAGPPSSGTPSQPGRVARGNVASDPSPRPSPLAPASPSEEVFPVSEPIRAGELLALDPLDPDRVHRAEGAADPRFIGIAAADSSDGEVVLATSRVITVWADAASGGIAPGDLLTTSPAPGLAMRAVNPAPGAVFGKALDPLESGTGEIRVLWMLR